MHFFLPSYICTNQNLTTKQNEVSSSVPGLISTNLSETGQILTQLVQACLRAPHVMAEEAKLVIVFATTQSSYFPKINQNHNQLLHNQTRPNSVCNLILTQQEDSWEKKIGSPPPPKKKPKFSKFDFEPKLKKNFFNLKQQSIY